MKFLLSFFALVLAVSALFDYCLIAILIFAICKYARAGKEENNG